MKYRIANGSWNDYSGPFTLSGYSAGKYQIDYYAIDHVDNIETIHSLNVQLIDSGLPPGIPGYNIGLIIGIVGVFSLPILFKKLKTKN